MAVLLGWLAGGPRSPTSNGNISGDLAAHQLDYWPLHDSAVRPVVVVPVTTHWPVAAAPRSAAGWLAKAFGGDWYETIHITPATLDVGNVVDTQVTELLVWNAYFQPRTLTAIDGIEEGMELEGPGDLPVTFGALEEQTWTISITRDGPGTIDAVLQWLFTGAPIARLRIIGDRVTEWPFRPDWSDGITERLAWLTDVLASPTAAEQRRAMRDLPRRSFELRFIVEGQERRLADLALAAWGARTWALPIWPDAQIMPLALAGGALSIACTTAGMDWRAGGLAMLIGSDAFTVESVEILSIAPGLLTLKRPLVANWPAGSLLCPARPAELVQQPRVVRKTDQLSIIDAVFAMAEACDWPAALPAQTYRGLPLFVERPDESEDLSHGWARLQLMLDNGSGLPRRTDTARVGLPVHAHTWMLLGRAEHSAWRSLLYGLRGRQRPMWLPTHADDLTLAVATPAEGLSIDVVACGLAKFIGSDVPAGRRDVRIELSNGTAVHCRVTGVEALAGGLERLTIQAAPGVTLQPAGVAPVHVTRMSWLQLCRLESDEVELLHVTDADGAARCGVVFRALRDELETA